MASAAFFVVRHGNTFEAGEPARRVGGSTDIPLTWEGELQAEALGEFFRGRDVAFTDAICGPLMRTRRTAEIILSTQGADTPLTIQPWLREIDYGVDENRPAPVAEARIGTAALKAWDAEAKLPPGWIADVPLICRRWQELFTGAAAPTTLVVTSNGIARFIFSIVDRSAGLAHPLTLRTGAYGLIERDRSGRLSCADWDVRPARVTGTGDSAIPNAAT